MKPTKHHFLQLLVMELEDMGEDVSALMENTRKRKAHGEVSEYVFNENMAIYGKLIEGIDCISEKLRQVDPSAYVDISDLIAGLRKCCDEHLPGRGFGSGLAQTVKRKMDKILLYLEHPPNP